jgi:hypothetical protein
MLDGELSERNEGCAYTSDRLLIMPFSTLEKLFSGGLKEGDDGS